MEHSSGAPVLLHHLCHEIAHLFGGALLHLPRDVGVGAEREACVEVSKHILILEKHNVFEKEAVKCPF